MQYFRYHSFTYKCLQYIQEPEIEKIITSARVVCTAATWAGSVEETTWVSGSAVVETVCVGNGVDVTGTRDGVGSDRTDAVSTGGRSRVETTWTGNCADISWAGTNVNATWVDGAVVTSVTGWTLVATWTGTDAVTTWLEGSEVASCGCSSVQMVASSTHRDTTLTTGGKDWAPG
jgi:hypothetical protein